MYDTRLSKVPLGGSGAYITGSNYYDTRVSALGTAARFGVASLWTCVGGALGAAFPKVCDS